MKRYAMVYAGLLGVMLVVFALAEALHVPLLTDDEPMGSHKGAGAALVGVALLAVDVVVPVPSSVVMVAHGALFGVAAGTALSMVGSLAAFAVGFALGRRSSAVVARVVTNEERRRADHLLRRWGVVAVILSRPVPLVAETVAFAAGASSLRWRSAVGAAALGYFPPAVLYAITGAVAATFARGAAVFIAVVAVALAAAVVVRPSRVRPEASPP